MLLYMAKQVRITEQLTSKQGFFFPLNYPPQGPLQTEEEDSSGWKKKQEGVFRFHFRRWRKRIQAVERYDLKKLGIALC